MAVSTRTRLRGDGSPSNLDNDDIIQTLTELGGTIKAGNATGELRVQMAIRGLTPRTNLSQRLDYLEKKGLLKRRRNGRRTSEISLTHKEVPMTDDLSPRTGKPLRTYSTKKTKVDNSQGFSQTTEILPPSKTDRLVAQVMELPKAEQLMLASKIIDNSVKDQLHIEKLLSVLK